MSKINLPACGKIYVRAPLRLESPLIIGSGRSEYSDLDLLRDPVTAKPMIPSTSIIGVFRSFLTKTLYELEGRLSPLVQENFKYLFGYLATEEEKNAAERKNAMAIEGQSALQCGDILLNHAAIWSRDGVKIDAKSNTAEASMKYNYEVVEAADEFELRLELTLRKGRRKSEAPEKEFFDVQIFKRMLLTIFQGIHDGHIRLGAKTNKGFGKLGIDLNAVAVTELNFANSAHVLQWLSEKPEAPANGKLVGQNLAPFAAPNQQFKIDAWFALKSAMLIKAYASDPGLPDAAAIDREVRAGEKRQRRAVLPGTSMMGAVQHRALKILNTLGDPHAQAKLEGLFGYVRDETAALKLPAEERKKPPAQKGRVRIEETLIENAAREVQTRIKIDRFTGGTIHGALFEMMPLWQKDGGDAIHVVITINDYQDWEPGLFLFILKDLWTGDLAIGGEKNVGRGVLQGRHANISWKENTARLQADATGKLEPAALAPLEALVTKFKEAMQS